MLQNVSWFLRVGGLLSITGLKAIQTESGDYLIRNFSIGIICASDKEDRNKNLLAFFSGLYSVSFKTYVVMDNGLSISGGNEYGSFSVTGGSGKYIYSVIGF